MPTAHPAYATGVKTYLTKMVPELVSERYVRWMSDPEVTRTLVAGRYPEDMESIRRFVQVHMTPPHVFLAIFWQETDEHIGNVKLTVDSLNRRGEFSIVIGEKDFWGKGVSTEVTALMLEIAFCRLNLHRVFLGVNSGNVAAIKSYQKVGFVEEGRARQEMFVDGKYEDRVIMGILAEEYFAQKNADNVSRI